MRKFLLLTLLCCATGLLWAKPLSPEQAMLRTQQNVAGSRMNTSGMKLVYTDAQNEQPAYYVFGRDKQQGYVIAGADDLASPVLGYVDDGTFDYANLPEQMKAWLQGYADEIAWARRHENTASTYRQASTRPQRSEIPLMVHAHWDQSAPYNQLCPTINGTQAPTGCVATAMAQILRFWNYPKKGTGSHSYTYNGLSLSMNFGNTTFDWANMPYILTDSWTSTQKTAVATLMKAMGVAMEMQYTASVSGAYTVEAGTRLNTYFGYSSAASHYSRDCYGLYEWEDMLWNSLKAGCPILYHGTGSAGGHAFVVDGYEGNGYFHLNWGWGNVSNGYFLITALDPLNLGIGGGAGGFNTNQGALLNLRPKYTGEKPDYQIESESYSPSVSGSTLSYSGGAWNYSSVSIPKVFFGFILENVNTHQVHCLEYDYYLANLELYHGMRSYDVNISSIPEGKYYIHPSFTYQMDGEWYAQTMQVPVSLQNTYILNKGASSNSISQVTHAELTGKNVKLGPKLYKGSACRLQASITNPSSTHEAYKNVYLAWYNTSGTLVGVGDAMYTNIPPATTIELDKNITLPTSVQKSPQAIYKMDGEPGSDNSMKLTREESRMATSLTAGGTYQVALATYNSGFYTAISPKVTVKLESGTPESATLTCSDLNVENGSSVDAMKVRITGTLNNTSGYFNNNIYVFTIEGSTQKQYFLTPEYFLNSGESAHLDYTFPFVAGEQGKTYNVLLNYRKQPSAGLSYLAQKNFTVGTTGVESVTDATEPELWIDGDNAMICGAERIMGVEVYNLQGQRRAANCSIDGTSATLSLGELESGIYLVRVITDKGAKTIRLMRP